MQTLKEIPMGEITQDGIRYQVFEKTIVYVNGKTATYDVYKKMPGQGVTIEKPERVVKMADILDSYAEYLETLSF